MEHIAKTLNITVSTVRNYLIRENLLKKQWEERREVCGCGKRIDEHSRCYNCGALWHEVTPNQSFFYATIQDGDKLYCGECSYKLRCQLWQRKII